MKIISRKSVTLDTVGGLPDDKRASVLRSMRKPLLAAFDIYKGNIRYGLQSETEAEHDSIVKWYTDILDLNPDAINNVPAGVAKYARKKN